MRTRVSADALKRADYFGVAERCGHSAHVVASQALQRWILATEGVELYG